MEQRGLLGAPGGRGLDRRGWWPGGRGAWGGSRPEGGGCSARISVRTPLGEGGEDGKPQLALELPTAGPGEGLCGLGQGSRGLTRRPARVRGQGQGHPEGAVAGELPCPRPPGSTSRDCDRGPDGPLDTLAPPSFAAPAGTGCCCVADGELACRGSQPAGQEAAEAFRRVLPWASPPGGAGPGVPRLSWVSVSRNKKNALIYQKLVFRAEPARTLGTRAFRDTTPDFSLS